MMELEGAPWPLVALAVGGIVFGMLPLLGILRRLVRAVRRQEQPPVGMLHYPRTLITAALLLGAGVLAAVLLLALRGYQAFTHKSHVAEVQCLERSPGKLRVTFVPIGAKGQRGATQTFDVDGDEWTVGGDVIRFQPYLTPLGLETVHRVTRVEGRWLSAADARSHQPTAFDVAGGTSSSWLTLYRDGNRGPLGWLIAGVHGQAVSQLPDGKAAYDVYLTPNGYIVDKRRL